jgi:hypothetical protein
MNTTCACSAEHRPAGLAKRGASDIQAAEPSKIDWKGIWKPLTAIVGAFLVFFGCRSRARASRKLSCPPWR